MTPISNNPEQTICEGDAIDNINVGYSGGAIGVSLSWWIDGVPALGTPSGLMVNNTGGVLSVSGTPAPSLNSSLIEYVVETTNSGCTPAVRYPAGDRGKLT